MRRHEIWIILIQMLSTTFSGIPPKAYLFHLPWACSVLHNEGGLVGACAILNNKNVLVSVDNFKELVHKNGSNVRYLEVIEELVVYAGSNFMDPVRHSPSPPSYQKQNASKLHVASKFNPNHIGTWEFKTNPKDISEHAGFEHNAYGLAFNIGILQLRDFLFYTEYIQPILFNGPDLQNNAKKYLSDLERAPLPKATCYTYSWNKKLNAIRYHEVVYVKNENCREVYCYWKLSKCNEFPRKEYLGCFRSVKYADVCPSARGAALYCPTFNNSVFAILTTAPSCGQRHLPGVYTTIPPAIELFEKVFNKEFHLPKSQHQLDKINQKNSDYDGIPY